jgi:hypothetical protein
VTVRDIYIILLLKHIVNRIALVVAHKSLHQERKYSKPENHRRSAKMCVPWHQDRLQMRLSKASTEMWVITRITVKLA